VAGPRGLLKMVPFTALSLTPFMLSKREATLTSTQRPNVFINSKRRKKKEKEIRNNFLI
jgi:hypothetical protein